MKRKKAMRPKKDTPEFVSYSAFVAEFRKFAKMAQLASKRVDAVKAEVDNSYERSRGLLREMVDEAMYSFGKATTLLVHKAVSDEFAARDKVTKECGYITELPQRPRRWFYPW